MLQHTQQVPSVAMKDFFSMMPLPSLCGCGPDSLPLDIMDSSSEQRQVYPFQNNHFGSLPHPVAGLPIPLSSPSPQQRQNLQGQQEIAGGNYNNNINRNILPSPASYSSADEAKDLTVASSSTTSSYPHQVTERPTNGKEVTLAERKVRNHDESTGATGDKIN